jgi:hypothetical protein
MTLADSKLNEYNCFVAMQYCWLILNRTYLVILTNSSIIGVVANGLVAAKGRDAIANYILKEQIVEGDLNNPFTYLSGKYLRKIENIDLDTGEILTKNRANFRLKYSDITDVRYDPKKKWGMGYYPHDGKVYLATATGKTIEFIILGNQSGELIQQNILSWKIGGKQTTKRRNQY